MVTGAGKKGSIVSTYLNYEIYSLFLQEVENKHSNVSKVLRDIVAEHFKNKKTKKVKDEYR